MRKGIHLINNPRGLLPCALVLLGSIPVGLFLTLLLLGTVGLIDSEMAVKLVPFLFLITTPFTFLYALWRVLTGIVEPESIESNVEEPRAI